MTSLNTILCQADVHYARQDWSAARECLRLALEIAPAHPQLLATLGNLDFLLEDFAEACTAFSAAVRHNPNCPDLRIQLALAHRELNQLGAAEAALKQALAMRPDDPFILKLLADCYREQQRPLVAGVIYRVLLDRGFDRVGVLLSLAKLLAGVGDWSGARAALEQLLIIDPLNELARDNLSMVAGKAVVHPVRHAVSFASTRFCQSSGCHQYKPGKECHRPPAHRRASRKSGAAAQRAMERTVWRLR